MHNLSAFCPLLLINGIDVTILWAGLAKRSKEISCSRNLVAARDFYDARRTFYGSSYKNLVEKKVRDTPLVTTRVPDKCFSLAYMRRLMLRKKFRIGTSLAELALVRAS